MEWLRAGGYHRGEKSIKTFAEQHGCTRRDVEAVIRADPRLLERIRESYRNRAAIAMHKATDRLDELLSDEDTLKDMKECDLARIQEALAKTEEAATRRAPATQVNVQVNLALPQVQGYDEATRARIVEAAKDELGDLV